MQIFCCPQNVNSYITTLNYTLIQFTMNFSNILGWILVSQLLEIIKEKLFLVCHIH